MSLLGAAKQKNECGNRLPQSFFNGSGEGRKMLDGKIQSSRPQRSGRDAASTLAPQKESAHKVEAASLPL
jgi:hypothetical protein